MATAKKQKTGAKKPKIKLIKTKDPNGDYISIAEYIRRRHKKDLEKDELATPLHASSILTKINEGYIPVIMEGGSKFIDWNISGDFIFKRYGQMPVKQQKA